MNEFIYYNMTYFSETDDCICHNTYKSVFTSITYKII